MEVLAGGRGGVGCSSNGVKMGGGGYRSMNTVWLSYMKAGGEISVGWLKVLMGI